MTTLADADPMTAQLAKRLRQAALGCTLHGHGPLNALVDIVSAHERGEVDGVNVCELILRQCRGRLTLLGDDTPEALRERKVATIIGVFKRGLEVG